MKKTFGIFLIYLLTVSCYSIQKIVPVTYYYTQSISYTIDKIEYGNTISTGDGNSWKPTRGDKFVFIYLTINNTLEENQELDFDNFVLLNQKTDTKFNVEWVMLTSPINIWEEIDSYIDKGDEIKRKLVYMIPNDDNPRVIMVNGKEVVIQYI